jgi:hypothetical protein
MCGSRFRCVFVLSERHRPAGMPGQPGHDLGYHVVMIRVTAGGQLRLPPLPFSVWEGVATLRQPRRFGT